MIILEELNYQRDGQRDDYRTGCLLENNYFKEHHKIAIDLSKQKEFDSDQK